MPEKYSPDEAIQRREAGLTDRLEPQEFLRLCTTGEDSFQTVDLSGADLSGARLPMLSLYGSNLEGANLTGAAIAEGSNLRETEMRGAILYQADLTGVNLSLANLSQADLRSANLTRANLYKANLKGAQLEGASFNQVRDISEVNLEGVQFNGCDLGKIQAGKAVLRRADLSHCNLQEAWLIGSDLQDARLVCANLAGAQIGSSNLRGCNLSGANLRGANLVTTNLQGADLRGADLSGANMTNAKTEGARMEGAILPDDYEDPLDLKLSAARRGVAGGKASSGTSVSLPTPSAVYRSGSLAQSVPGSIVGRLGGLKKEQRLLILWVGIHMAAWLAAYLLETGSISRFLPLRNFIPRIIFSGLSVMIPIALVVVQWQLLKGSSTRRFFPAVVMNLAGCTLMADMQPDGGGVLWQSVLLFVLYMWALSRHGVRLWTIFNVILGFGAVSLLLLLPDRGIIRLLVFVLAGGVNAAITGTILFLRVWKREEKLERKW